MNPLVWAFIISIAAGAVIFLGGQAVDRKVNPGVDDSKVNFLAAAIVTIGVFVLVFHSLNHTL